MTSNRELIEMEGVVVESLPNAMFQVELENGFEEAMIKKDTNERIKFFNLGKKNSYKELLDSKLIDKMNFSFQDQIEKYYDK